MKVSPTTRIRGTNEFLHRTESSTSTVQNRNRRPSFRSRPTKRDIADLASTGRSQSSFNVLSTGNDASEGPPRAEFMGLKRTKSEIASEPHSSFAMDLNDPLGSLTYGGYANVPGGSDGDDEINQLAARLGSRRVSITSQDEEADDIAKIVAQAAFPASTLMSSISSPTSASSNNKTKVNQRTGAIQKSKNKSSITSTVKKLMKKKNLTSLSKFQKAKKSSLKTKPKANLPGRSTIGKTKQSTLKIEENPAAVAARSEWTAEEDILLKSLVKKYGVNEWKSVQEKIHGKTCTQIQYRWNKVLRPGLRKGTWTKEEDEKLIEYVTSVPKKNWGEIASLIAGRSAKQCRERWCYNLDPSINKNAWTPEEDRVLVQAQSELGNRWAHIASLLPGRTENAVKTRFKSIMRAKKREWLPEEDSLILKMHQEVGSRWDAIAEKLPSRTKNAVKTRFRQLGKGCHDSPTTIGAPNQILRRDPVPVKSPATLAELTEQITKAHEALTAIDSVTPIPTGVNHLSNSNARGTGRGRAKAARGRGKGRGKAVELSSTARTQQNQWDQNDEQKHYKLQSQYQNDTVDDLLGIINGVNGENFSMDQQYAPKSGNMDTAYYGSYPTSNSHYGAAGNVNSFNPASIYTANNGSVKQLQAPNIINNFDAEMEDGFDLLEMLK
eukprot:CAMPEP_0204874072 /NCGR_PEP_ID=MMETSP1348-20121228/42385_1 /ASSEMBLY_ACC=CAM_ASM_000700 /TAXON_ID=215587 /ORGANISM="Aplanochytrium stocchinoi, Strain GSBS06" /LENGTH=665 /DNA_ID=CAMNT_0052029723 /DNA_START=171 /DNA_END=2168 /DNA_ORIENTATION=+